MTRSTISPTILICAGVSVLALMGLIMLWLRKPRSFTVIGIDYDS